MKNSGREIALTGGLGNQLFQIAAALAIFNGEKFAVDCELGSPRLNKSNLPELESFHFNAPIEWASERRNNFYKRLFGLGIRLSAVPNFSLVRRLIVSLYKVIFTITKFLLGNSKSIPIVISQGVGFDERIPKTMQSGFIMGYFQTFKYLENKKVREVLMSLRPKEFSSNFLEIQAQMKSTKNIVLHIRLGDYRNEAKIGLLSGQYYSMALSDALQTMPGATVWLFSDEPHEAIKLICPDLLLNVRLVDEDLSTSETFELMRFGDLYIISNSTFSWWAASLSRKPDCRVTAPQPWFLNQESPIELIPTHWISLSRNSKSRII